MKKEREKEKKKERRKERNREKKLKMLSFFAMTLLLKILIFLTLY